MNIFRAYAVQMSGHRERHGGREDDEINRARTRCYAFRCFFLPLSISILSDSASNFQFLSFLRPLLELSMSSSIFLVTNRIDQLF